MSENLTLHIDKIYGQEKAVMFLRNTLENESVADSYLFSGKEGLGKKILARYFVQSLLCERGTVFMGCDCDSCAKVASGIHADVVWIGLDEEERYIKIDTIRSLQSSIKLRPLEGKRKVYIVNKAERMTEEASNAFLKTLEEPPAYTHIILLADNKLQLLHTILSRVVEVSIVPLSVDDVCTILASDFAIREEARYLAHQSQGSVGLALKYYAEEFFAKKNKILDALMRDGMLQFFLNLTRVEQKKLDEVLYVLCTFYHDVLLMKIGVDASRLINQDRLDDCMHISKRMKLDGISSFLTVLEKARRSLKRHVNAKLLLAHLASVSEKMFRSPTPSS